MEKEFLNDLEEAMRKELGEETKEAAPKKAKKAKVPVYEYDLPEKK